MKVLEKNDGFIRTSSLLNAKVFDKTRNLPSQYRDAAKIVLREVGKIWLEMVD